MKRRNFLKKVGLGVAAAGSFGFPMISHGAGESVVVVGGGVGGATFAKYLKKLEPSAQISLIEENPQYYTCFMSNEVLGGDRQLDSLRVDYQGLAGLGIQVIQDRVVNIDPAAKSVITQSGQTYHYNRCIVSPGIDFRYDEIEGYDANVAERIPHAWKAGGQTLTLRAQLEAMPDGGVFVLAAPPNPFRCPPAPYERASQIAHYFKQYKPNAKIQILDPKASFAKQSLFMQAWRDLYGFDTDNSMIEWISGSEYQVAEVNVADHEVVTNDGERFHADVINLIPPQKANWIAHQADLIDESGWCPVDRRTFESTRHAGIYVLGDACTATALPKSGFAANSEAKNCAVAMSAAFKGIEAGDPSFSNACYSVVGSGYAISVMAVYTLSEDGQRITPVPGAGGLSRSNASEEERLLDVEYAYSWYNNFVQDTFHVS
jgi:sulfide dehydrogenase [flavocytochrome c] flavoprotein subunit